MAGTAGRNSEMPCSAHGNRTLPRRGTETVDLLGDLKGSFLRMRLVSCTYIAIKYINYTSDQHACQGQQHEPTGTPSASRAWLCPQFVLYSFIHQSQNSRLALQEDSHHSCMRISGACRWKDKCSVCGASKHIERSQSFSQSSSSFRAGKCCDSEGVATE